MKIELPGIREQQRIIFEESTKEAIATLKANLKAPELPPQEEIDESQYQNTHLLRLEEGWQPPHKDVIAAYFKHFQNHFKEYNSDKKLADLIGVSSDRRIREYKSGARVIPYGLWRKFLIMTGRAPQDVLPVLAYMG